MKDNAVQTKFHTSLAPRLMVKVGNSARAVERNFHICVRGFLQSRDYKPLFFIPDGLRQDNHLQLWIERLEAQENSCNGWAFSGQKSIGVKILLKMFHNT
jgi:hypothetical protein